MAGRHRDSKYAETIRATTPKAKPRKKDYLWPKGDKQTPSDMDPKNGSKR